MSTFLFLKVQNIHSNFKIYFESLQPTFLPDRPGVGSQFKILKTSLLFLSFFQPMYHCNPSPNLFLFSFYSAKHRPSCGPCSLGPSGRLLLPARAGSRHRCCFPVAAAATRCRAVCLLYTRRWSWTTLHVALTI
jgi:hypothetical protein